MPDGLIKTGRLVTVFGGSGFIGRHVVRALARAGWRIRVASRRPELALYLQPLGRVGQIHAVQANLRFPESVAKAIGDSEAVINLVGILRESGRQRFEAVHGAGALVVAKAAGAAGAKHLVHMSAIGADPQSDALYAKTKATGERAVRETFPTATILRPSVVFGPEDDFFNRFAALARILPALPVIGGGETKLQPVFVGDVAHVVARCLEDEITQGVTFELGGPKVKSLREIVAYICSVTGRKRLLIPIPFGIAHYVPALMTEIADKISFGLFPKLLLTTRDQIRLLRYDNVVSAEALAQNRTLEWFGITPQAIETIVPSYLYRFRKTGQFDRRYPA